ncbi:MAG: hypothetical protein HQK65_00085 [Desulfamplus sp.]|nr:hypothetical protein [Desulfamplus sp.]
MVIKELIKAILPMIIIEKLKQIKVCVLTKSLQEAVCEQGLRKLYFELSEIVPDIKNQYSAFVLDSLFKETKVRGQHAFQISLVQKSIEISDLLKKKDPVCVDIGDSAGTHIQYIKSLFGDMRTLSVNLDEEL